MKNRTKKLIAFLLTLAMTINILPLTSLAEGEEQGEGATIVSQPQQPVLRSEGSPDYVQIDMEYHVDDLSGLANHYVVVGPFGGFKSKNILTEMPADGTYGFTEIKNTDDYFVVLKTADSKQLAEDKDGGSTEFYFSKNTNPISGSMDIVNGRYTVVWSKTGDHHYKMMITEKATKHKATVTAPEGFDYSNLYLVFMQDGAYSVKEVNAAGIYSSDETLKVLWQDNRVNYDAGKTTEVRLVKTTDQLTAANVQDWQVTNASSYDGGEQYDVSIVTAGNETTVTITEASHKVALRFFEGEATTATPVTLTDNNYTLVATAGSTTYTASLTGSNEELSFIFGNNQSMTELPKVTSWEFKKDSETVTVLDGYELTAEPTIETGSRRNAYVWNARKPKQYTVTVKAYDESGAEESNVSFNGYRLTAATDEGTYSGTLEVKENLTLSGGIKSYLPKVNSFEIKNSSNQTVTSVGDYKIVYPENMNPTDGKYIIQLKKPRTCTANITISEDVNLTDGDYYIVAWKNGTAAGYAKIDKTSMSLTPFATNTGFYRFSRMKAGTPQTIGTGGEGHLTIDEDTAFSVVKVASGTAPTAANLSSLSEENSATSAPMNQGTGKIGDNKFNWTLEAATETKAPNYAFEVTKQTLPGGVVRSVNINLYSYDGTTRVNDGNQEEDLKENLSGKKLVVVARLEDKSTTDSKAKIIGYQAKDVPTNGSGQYQDIYFENRFKGTHYNHSEWTEYYQDDDKLVTYNSDTHNISIRLYEIDAGASSEYAQYNNIIQYNDTVTGYQFKAAPNGNVTSGDVTTLNLQKAYPLKYQVKLKFNEPVQLAEADDVCLRVEVKHSTSTTDVYFGKVIGSGTEITVVLEDQSTNPATKNWTSGGTGLLTGNEDYTIQIVTGSGGQSDSQAQAIIPEGGYAVGYTVSYSKTGRTQETVPGEHASVITDYVDFTKLTASNDTNYLAILGQGVNFAITADSFDQQNHIQANFATNLYKSKPQPIEPDLNANATGSVVIANVDHSGSDTIQIGQKTPGTLLVYVNNNDLNSGITVQDDSKKAVTIPSDGNYLTNTIVEPIISHMEKMSAALNKPATLTPAKPIGSGQVLVIDTTSFGDNDTIYINGDDIRDYINGSDKLKIKKKDDQTIVFNFIKPDDLTIGQFLCTVEGQEINSSSPVSSTEPKNELVDKVAQRIVWNCVNCSKVTVSNTTGIFLLPKDNNTFDITGTSSGWIISDGKVVNSGGEWHGVYRNMTSYDEATLNARKTIENNTPKASERFVFQVYRYDPNSPDAEEDGFKPLKNGDDLLEAENNGEAVAFTISEYAMGWNVYKIKESRVADGVTGSYTISDAVYYAEFEVTKHEDVNLTVVYPGLPKYYSSFDTTTERCVPATEITGTPTFDNAINREGLTLQKQVQGVNAPDALFNFVIELWKEVKVTDKNISDPEIAALNPKVDDTVILPVTGTHTVSGTAELPDQTLNFETNAQYPNHGVATIALHQNETVKIADIDVGTKYRITEVSTQESQSGEVVNFTENKANGYTSSVSTAQPAEGEITEGGNAVASFINRYESSAFADFKVKKTVTHGTLKDKQFTFRLTQIKSAEDPAQAVTNVKLTAPVYAQTTEDNEETNEIVTLLSNLKFTNADDGKDFFFLIEEVIPDTAENGIDDGFQYDTKEGQIIELHVSDDKKGNLTITRTPKRTAGLDYDVEYTNDKLGSVEVTKAFKNAPSLPADFKITAKYTLEQKEITKTLKVGAGSNFPMSGVGSEAEPFKWVIPDLPVGTNVTFEETGLEIDGYSVNVIINNKASEDPNETKAAAIADVTPGTAGFINEYTRDLGSLRILKKTTVTDAERTDTTLVDGTYTFTLASEESVKPATNKTVTITIVNGAVTGVGPTEDDDITQEEVTIGGKNYQCAKISNLPTGKYTVTEDTTRLAAKHITLKEQPEDAITVSKNNTNDIPVAIFRNDYEAGDLKISKTVTGTSDKTKDFTFVVMLTPPSGVELKDSYPVIATDAVKTNNRNTSSDSSTSVFTENGKITLTAGTAPSKSVTIKLRADESIQIKDLPTGTTYSVEEKGGSLMPAGYEQTQPADKAEGKITTTLSKAEFENTYNLETISVTFGGLKKIEGIESTGKQFCFELYKVDDANYFTAGKTPVETHTSGTIGTAGRSYNFKTITYDRSMLGAGNAPADFYYVIKEKVFNEPDYSAEGWTADTTEYRRHVVVSDDGAGKLVAKIYEPDGTGESEVGTNGHPISMDFTNTYKATGSVSFNAKKVFTGGTIENKQFSFRLKQVKAEGSEEVPENPLFPGEQIENPTEENPIVAFNSLTFEKKIETKQDETKEIIDQTGVYWFLLEEVIPQGAVNGIIDGIQYETNNRKWIKVTVTDNGDGTLKAEKSPAPTKEGETDLDAVFTNEQLGSVKVTKSFVDKDNNPFTQIPENFKIMANWRIGNTDYSKELTIDNVDTGNSTQSTAQYTWTIKDLPLSTKVTFTESGITVDGYTLAVTGATLAADGESATTTPVTPAISPTVTDLVNTYTRDTGKLQIRKTLMVNESTTIANADYSLIDGTYKFRVKSTEGVTPETEVVITVTLTNGVVTNAGFDGTVPTGLTLSTDAILAGLPTGSYTVTEELTEEQIARGIEQKVKPQTNIDIPKEGQNVTIPIADFTNNRNVGELEVSKAVSGTTDNTQDFTFVVTLTPLNGVKLENSYPVETTDVVKENNTDNSTNPSTSVFIADDRIALTGTDSSKSVTIKLKADQKILIKELPAGTTYKVQETVMPADYEQIDPAGDAQGTITTDKSTAAFINNYKKNTTSVAFGGVKYIEGRDSTSKVFTFELYDTTSSTDHYTIADGQQPIQTVSTSGEIGSAGQNYSFRAITYNTVGDHYYVIKEKAFSDSEKEGWDTSTVVYYEHVHVYEDTEHNSVLTRTVTRKTATGEEINEPGTLDFTNTYTANGDVTFSAKKIFTGDILNNHPFVIRLTQVTGDGKTEQATAQNTSVPIVLSAPIEKTVNADDDHQTVTFGRETSEKISFEKKLIEVNGTKTQQDDCGEYWFLLEELDSNTDQTGIRNDDHPRRWIKVTVTDNGNGTLNISKDPTTTNDGTTDLDATFHNEQLGSVKVTKIFKNDDDSAFMLIPDNFKITAAYDSTTIELTKDTEGRTGTGTPTDPFVWEIKDLPIGQEVTFTESGMTVDGYSVVSTFTDTSGTEQTTETGAINAAKTAPTGAFVNTYTRKTGSLKIKKTVTVNGSTPASDADYSLVDGTYKFRVKSAEGVVPTTEATVAVTLSKGKVANAAFDGTAPNGIVLTKDETEATLSKLPTGKYEIEEVIDPDAMTKKGIVLSSPEGGKVTREVKADQTTGIPTADFTNNKDIGSLKIKKTVNGTEENPQEFSFDVTLTPPTGVTLDNVYPIEATDAVKTENASIITEGKICLSDGTDNKKIVTIKLKDGETLLIKQLPADTTYTVHEKTDLLPSGYTKASPAGDDTNTIVKNSESVSAFVNNYSLSATSVTFGGTKMIEGQDSTTQEFTFELYQTGADFKIDSNAILLGTKKITGTISSAAGRTYGFDPIVYDKQADVGLHYYVIREKALTPSTNGWTFSTPEYHETVEVVISSEGKLSYTASPRVANQLNFTNTYSAKTDVTFQAKKIFTDGNLKNHPFKIRLTQVTGDGKTEQATASNTTVPIVLGTPIEKTVNADADHQTVTFGQAANEKITFVKTKDRDDTQKEFWFLLEEIDENSDKTGIQNDDHPKRWIKVTLTDNGKGRLTLTKSPTAENNLDATFTNKQLGSVKVTKAFKNADGSTFTPIPANFKITATWKIGDTDFSKELKIADVDRDTNGDPMTSPYTWTIDNLPLTTKVTFTESGMTVDGYSLAVTGATLAADKQTAEITDITPAIHPAATALINTYTRETGSLKIKKAITVNGSTNIAAADYAVIQGTYTITVKEKGQSNAVRTVAVTFDENGHMTAKVNGTSVTPDTEGYIQIDHLPTGEYEIEEVINQDAMTKKGIVLASPEGGKITKSVEADQTVGIPTADFTNNKDIGSLEISKSVNGTSDKTQSFSFQVTLTPKIGTTLEDSYPVAPMDAVKANNEGSLFTANGRINLTDGTGDAKTFTVKLRADEKITIRQLPAGTAYTVHEDEDKKNMPAGYQKTSPSGDVIGNITTGATGSAAFVNQYNLGSTTVTFGGSKTIYGTEKTSRAFTFELYKANEQFEPEGNTLQTKTLTGETGKDARSYSFDPITYKPEHKGQTFYYLVKETVNDTDGWTTSKVVYHETVSVSDGGDGKLTATVTTQKIEGNTSESISDGKNKLDFINTYEAKGGVTFKAKKVFTGGDLSQKTFTFKLTQVDGENSTTAPTTNVITISAEEATKTIHTSEKTDNQTVEFNLENVFYKGMKNGTLQDDTKNEYWFLLEEVIPTTGIKNGIKDGIRYETNNRKWIKVTLSDNGSGTLEATKYPGADSDGLDVIFTNEQLGGVKVTKAFMDADGKAFTEIPENTFKITATWQNGTKTEKKELTTANVDKDTSNQPITSPYTWTINDLPIGTEVTFIESGMTVDGYSVSSTFTKTVNSGVNTTTATAGRLSAAETAPTGAFVNTYIRDTGSLRLKKTVTVNGVTPSEEDFALVKGTYTILLNPKGTQTQKIVKFIIDEQGKVTAEVGGSPATLDKDGYVVIDNLPTGIYRIFETELTPLANKGILPVSPTGGETEIEITKNQATIPTVEIINNKDIGQLKISKTLKRSSNREVEFTFTVELKDKKGEAVTGTFPATLNQNNGKIETTVSFDDDGQLQPNLKLHADESIVIRQIPAGANYTVSETLPADSPYTQTIPASGADAIGPIVKDETAEAAFENTYNLKGTSLTFGGKKSIAVADSTTQRFRFELYQTSGTGNTPFAVADNQKPLETAETEGTIKADEGQNFSFATITYEVPATKANETPVLPITRYYVVREAALNENGWTQATTLYRRKVVINDGGNGTLEKKIYDCKEDGSEIREIQLTRSGTTGYDFTNNYSASGGVSFTAKKKLINGDLSRHPFIIRLTQVDGDQSTTQATGDHVVLAKPIEKIVNQGNEQTITFSENEIGEFVKKKIGDTIRDDTAVDFWFMIEESDPGSGRDIIMDQNRQRWIKVTLADDGVGNLTATKTPGANTTFGADGNDAVFTNEQLGGVKVSKVFAGHKAPDAFAITAKYTLNGTEVTRVLRINADAGAGEIAPAGGDGTAANPYIWEIGNLPIGTAVAFTESGMTADNYTYTASFNGTANKTSGEVNADSEPPTGAFVNTYIRDTGKLRIKKNVTVNGLNEAYSMADGVYTFTVKSDAGVEPETTKTLSMEIREGKLYAVTGKDCTKDGEYAVVAGLPTGTYTVSEDESNLPAEIKLTRKPVASIDVKKDNDADIPTAEFTNDRTLTIKVQKTDVTIGEELTGAHIQILDKDGEIVDEWDSEKGKPHEVTKLKAGETYALRETVAPDGYTVTADTTFTIEKDGKITSEDTTIRESDGALLVEDAMTRVKVQKTDVTTGEELTGAHIQILDKNGTVVDEWDSEKGKPHEVTKLKTGETYTLRETVAPDGYMVTADTTFTIDENGKVTSEDTTIRTDGVLLVEDERIPLMSAAVRKVWDDGGNRDGLRPAALKIDLLADGEATGLSVTLNAANNWTGTLKDLPVSKNEKKITYTWKESEVIGYTLKSSKAETGTLTTLTNTHAPEKTEVSVKKVWDDGNDGLKKRPDAIEVQLYADGKALGDAVTLNDDNGWAYTWKDLYLNAFENGASDRIRYTVAETEIPEGYVCTVTGTAATGFVITNTYHAGRLIIEKSFAINKPELKQEEEEETTDFEVQKIWLDDNDDADGNRPESITVRLYAGGIEIKEVQLKANNGWKYHFGDLPKYKDGKPIHYSVSEDPVDGYSTEIDGFRIYNRYQPERTHVTVRKIWNDDDNKQKIRPESILMKLNNGMTVILSEENGWMASITDLPAKVNGKPAEYTWTEQTVMGYELESKELEDTVTTFTNKPWTRPEQPSQGRKPKTAGETLYVFDEYDTPLGVEIVINHVGDCFD